MLETVPLFPSALAGGLPQALSLAGATDTLVARTIVQRDALDWVTGGLTLVALALLVALLVGLVLLVLAMRRGVRDVTTAVHRLSDEARPLVTDAQGMMTELHGMIRQVRADVERLTGAAGTVGDHVREAADEAADRLEALGVTLDQLQEELESTVETASGALRGLRLAVLGMLMGDAGPREPRPRRRRRGRSAGSSRTPPEDREGPFDDPQAPDA